MIDIGANLCHDSFESDRDEVLAAAREMGVHHIVVTGSCMKSVPAACELASKHPTLLSATAGIHPHHAEQVDDNCMALLSEYGSKTEVVASGEMGLDFYRDFCPHDVQERAFHRQMEWAVSINKPAFLHQRDAHDRFLPILKEYLDHLPAAVVHCFTGTAEELHAYIDQDLYIGITGWICDERRGRHLWDIIASIPSDRLLIETDAPYLLPRNLDPKPAGRRNEPKYLPAVAGKIAQLLDVPADTIARQTTANAQRFFGLK